MSLNKIGTAIALTLVAGSAHAISVTASTNATALATAIAGSGVAVSNATLTSLASNTAAGTFTGGAGSVGFADGVVLTSGFVNCVPGPNLNASCGGGGTTTSLKFDFTSDTGEIFFQYVFGSEEYNEYVNSVFNDKFQLLLNGVNIAQLPGGLGVVEINNVNCGKNSQFYKNNSAGGSTNCPNLGLDIQYDGLTTVLTAGAKLAAGTNTFEFKVFDVGDAILDSGVFIKAGSFSGKPPSVPEPGTLALLGLGLVGLAAGRRKMA